jgi:hypothetical protein
MEDQHLFIKDDINFLEYPNWIIDKRNEVTFWIIKKPNGCTYNIKSPEGLPSYFDKKVLYYLMHKLYTETNLETYALTTTRYEIGINISPDGNRPSKKQYENIMDSLWKWKAIAIHFEGVFYEVEGYTVRFFSIIDEVVLNKRTGALSIRFNKSYIDQQRLSTFYKLIDFQKYKRFSSATAARLYELLIKNFKDRDAWPIGIQLLAEKMTMEKRCNAKYYYPSDVMRHLKPAINEINKNTDIFIVLDYNKKTGVCIFKKGQKPKQYTPATTATQRPKKKPNTKDIDVCYEYYSNLPLDERNRIKQASDRDPLLTVIQDQKSKIFAYMRNKGLWPASE